jgi:hypothetical protein
VTGRDTRRQSIDRSWAGSGVYEELGKRIIELFAVHWQEPHYQMRVTGYAVNASSRLMTGIRSTMAWAMMSRSNDGSR